MRNRKWFALTLSLPKTVFSLPISANYRCKLKLSYLRLPYCLGFLGTNPLASSLHHPTPTSLRKRKLKSLFCHHYDQHYQSKFTYPYSIFGRINATDSNRIHGKGQVTISLHFFFFSVSVYCQSTVSKLLV